MGVKPLLVCAAVLLLTALAPHAEAAPDTCQPGGGPVTVDTDCRQDPFVCTVYVATQPTGSHCVLRHA